MLSLAKVGSLQLVLLAVIFGIPAAFSQDARDATTNPAVDHLSVVMPVAPYAVPGPIFLGPAVVVTPIVLSPIVSTPVVPSPIVALISVPSSTTHVYPYSYGTGIALPFESMEHQVIR